VYINSVSREPIHHVLQCNPVELHCALAVELKRRWIATVFRRMVDINTTTQCLYRILSRNSPGHPKILKSPVSNTQIEETLKDPISLTPFYTKFNSRLSPGLAIQFHILKSTSWIGGMMYVIIINDIINHFGSTSTYPHRIISPL